MTNLRQIAQQALDAIHLWHWAGETHLLMAAHDALRTALAQPEQEPVAFCYVKKTTSADALTFNPDPANAVDNTVFPLFTSPPERPWVGLTDDEYQEILKQHDDAGLLAFYDLVETKLKEKNT